MSMHGVQANTGGLKLKTNFNAKAVAANITANRSALAGNYSIFNTGSPFVAARRMGGTPKYMNASQISRAFNGQNMSYISGGAGNISSAKYTQNLTMGPSDAFVAGNTIGTLLGAAPTIIGMLNQLGVFGSNNDSPRATLSQRMQSAFGDITPTSNLGATSSAGLPAANSFGSNFDNTYNSVEAYMRSGTMEPGALRTSAQNLVTNATNDLNNAEANFNILKGRQADAMSNQTKLQENLTTAEKGRNEAKTELGTRQGVLKSAKDNRAQKDAALSAKDDNYKNACTDLTNKETIKEQKQTAVNTCKQEVTTAETALTQATANKNAAQQAYDAIPDDSQHSAQKAAAKSALDQAKQAEEQAKQKLEQAKEKLTKAEEELQKANGDVEQARQAKEEALKELEKTRTDLTNAIKDCRDAEKQVQSAQTQFDNATEAFNNSDAEYTKAKAAMDDANGVIAQCGEYETTMKTLQDNLKKAAKLQEKANNAADKYEKKHPANTSTGGTPGD